MTFDPSALPKSLIEAYQQGRCAVFVGAGASQASGLPGWDDFLTILIDRCIKDNRLTEEAAADYKALVGKDGKQLRLASALKDKLGETWDEVILDTFHENEKEPSHVHKVLPALERLAMVITTNYDSLIEQAYTQALGRRPSVLNFNDGGEIRRLMHRRKFFVLKAHGDAEKPGNGIILTVSDYRRLASERAYQSLLASIFTLNTIFFVGVSLVDPELTVLLDYLSDTFEPGGRPTHYALIPADEMNQVEQDRWLKDYLIQVIPISSENNFEQVPQALEALAKAPETGE
ncbi:hypothetical protein E3U23_07440 [Erythrobacter litoralis]|uniref:SIR2 family protein n=1 Tax=Erythrobacter litoralis TaxID=39960 RepID=UPI002434D455|nr:SIR2 family protein [Erythrobacter litoralis]MDG6079023.1 hypothetical protein [Erythrobacter litoralis]